MRALVLEGGGARGAYQAGAIKALCKKGIYFDAAGGTSIGAINAAFYVIHNFDAMYKLWLSTSSDELFGIDAKLLDGIYDGKITADEIRKGFSEIIKVIKSRGVDTTNIKKILSKYLKEDRFMRSKIEYGMVSYNLSDRKPVMMFKKDIPKGKLAECVLSSAYLPFFKFEKIIDDKYYLDGGMVENCPVDLFVNAGYDEIFVIKNWQSKLKYKNKKGVRVHIVTPREDLGSIIRFTKASAEYKMNLGYYDMLKYLDQLDGNNYYFKYYSNDYYKNLFEKNIYKRIFKKYNNGFPPRNEKEFILKIVEKACEELDIERFRVYNMPYLLTKLKLKILNYKDSKYYDFIKNIRIDFE
jgi:NTE family protein